MSKSQNVAFVRYEYMVYIHLLNTYNVNEISLTMDDFVDTMSDSDHINWTPVKNMNIDIIDSVDDIGNGSDAFSKISKNRICGLFDAEPLDWKYARILVDNKTSTKYNFAIAKMPRSPIIPIVFDLNK